MEHLLPIALRSALHALVSFVLADLSSVFCRICSKSIDLQQLPLLQDHVVHTLCHMEMIFPPFFIVMVHLIVNLVEEVHLGGLVHYRWMYPIESCGKILRVSVFGILEYENDLLQRESCEVPLRSIRHSNDLQWLACGLIFKLASVHLTTDREDDEPYILLSKARLVYYVDDKFDKEWSVVVHVKPKDLFDMDEDNEHCKVEEFDWVV
ncbi:hypothetical protein AHAS_Ahas07G0126200 [Arachis hypogaea]